MPALNTLKSKDIALLNESRQKILVKLAFEDKTLSRLATAVNLQPQSVFESLDLLEKRGFVKKDENKLFSLTKEGKMLAFAVMKPNGLSEERIKEAFNQFLLVEYNIQDPEKRFEIMEQLRFYV